MRPAAAATAAEGLPGAVPPWFLGVPKPLLPPPTPLSVRNGGAIPSCLRTAIDMRGPSTAAAAGALLFVSLSAAAAAAAATDAAVETAEEGCVIAADAKAFPAPPPTGPKRVGTDCWCRSIEEALEVVFSPKSGGANGENPAPPDEEAPPPPPPAAPFPLPLPPPAEVAESGVPGPLCGMLAIPLLPTPPREAAAAEEKSPEPPSKKEDDDERARGWWCSPPPRRDGGKDSGGAFPSYSAAACSLTDSGCAASEAIAASRVRRIASASLGVIRSCVGALSSAAPCAKKQTRREQEAPSAQGRVR